MESNLNRHLNSYLNHSLRLRSHVRLATSQSGANRLINSKIPHQFVTIIQPDGKLSENPVKLDMLLRQIDQTTEFIELISSREKPLVKIRNKKEALEQEKLVKKKRAASRVVNKELQLSWVISQGDLTHKLLQARQYFQKGHVVSIQFAAKQGHLPPSPPDRQKLIDQVHDALGDIAIMHRVTNAGKGVTARTIVQSSPRDIPGQDRTNNTKTDIQSAPSAEPSLP